MNKLILLFTFLFANTAMACPMLAGSYKCETGDQINISQKLDGEVTLYTINEEEFRADGVRHSKKKGYYEFVKQYSCSGDSFVWLEEQISEMFSTYVSRDFKKDGSNLFFTYTQREVDHELGEDDTMEQSFPCRGQ